MVPRRYLPIVITNNILKEQKYVRTIHLKYRIKKYVNNILNNLKHENDTSVWYVPNVARRALEALAPFHLLRRTLDTNF